MTDLPAVMQIESDGHNLLFFLIADECALQPEDGLREGQGTDALDMKTRVCRHRKGAMHSARKIVRRQVQADDVHSGESAALHRVGKEPIHERRAEAD